MSTRWLTALLMTAALALPALAAPRYDSPEHDFSVAFPSAPVVEGRRSAGDDDSSWAIYDVQDHGAVFRVRVDRYPASLPAPKPDKTTYQLLLRGHAVESASRLVSSGPVRLGGHPAMQGVFAGGDGGRQQMRVLMLGRRVYQVSYSGPDEAAAAFLDSFRLSGR